VIDYKRLYQELLEDVEYQEKFFLFLAREYRADALALGVQDADYWHNDGFAQAYSIAAKFTRSIKEKAQAKEATNEKEVKNYG
jgi:hypothetical protein